MPLRLPHALALLLLAATPAASQPSSPGPLSQAHAALDVPSGCESCHGPDRRVTASNCLACHAPIADRMARGRGVHRDVTDDCTGCHVEHQGVEADLRPLDPASFDHASETGFALDGRHAPLAGDCAKCHTTRSFLSLTPACSSCHADPHLGQATRPCQACHTTSGFAIDRYAHAGLEGFFVGRHATLECVQCHRRTEDSHPSGRGAAVTLKVGTECSSCHRDAHDGALGATCTACHAPDGWRTATRAFHKVTIFPLEGRHLGVPCASCHLNGQVRGTPNRCYDCHWVRRQDDLYRTRLGNECEECHRPTSWTAVNWDHGARTGMALNAAHRLLACDSCHKEQVFAGSRPECFACHEAQYRAAGDPNHLAAGFPTACDLCHRPTSPTFVGATFTHASFTLVGQHGTATCASCHRNGLYAGTPRECVGCHLSDYQRTDSPNHAAAGFPTACDTCHRPTDPGWRGSASFNHAAIFQLSGQHASAACTACHQNNGYRGTPRDCVVCHQADYQRTQNPNHAAAGFPTSCDSCHRSGGPGWGGGGGFSHGAIFTLSGVHATTSCTNCHRNGQFKGTPRDCVACHQADYQRAQNPNHAAAGFPTACESCHRSGGPGWAGAAFTHNQFFALQGVHASQPCAACHRSGQYRGTPRECVGCHLSKYQNTRNPNHAGAGFPTTCETCHRATDASWNQGRFTHTGFPITSGRHAGNPCSACHLDAGNFRSFTCLTCHDRNKMDREHEGRAGYRYDSNACYSCHPQGRD